MQHILTIFLIPIIIYSICSLKTINSEMDVIVCLVYADYLLQSSHNFSYNIDTAHQQQLFLSCPQSW